MIGSNITTIYISVLSAVGKVNTSLRILIWWTLADWALALALCPFYGFTGIAMAYGLSVIPISVWLVLELNSVVRIDLWRSFSLPLILSCSAAVLVWVVKTRFAASWVSVSLLAATGLLAFLVPLLLLEKRVLLAEGKVFLGSVLKDRTNAAS
jgi:O-antigen/teichoic acid export membrane protein